MEVVEACPLVVKGWNPSFLVEARPMYLRAGIHPFLLKPIPV